MKSGVKSPLKNGRGQKYDENGNKIIFFYPIKQKYM